MELEDVQAGIEVIPMAARAGLVVEVVEHGRARVRVPFDGNGNHFGTMYAGGPFLAAEILGGVLCLGTFDVARFFPLLTGIDLRFTAVATTDVTAEVAIDDDEAARIRDEAATTGKSRFDLDVEVRDTHGNVVATVTGHYQLRRSDNVPTLG